VELAGRHGPESANLAKLRKERTEPRHGFLSDHGNRQKSPHGKRGTSPPALFTF